MTSSNNLENKEKLLNLDYSANISLTYLLVGLTITISLTNSTGIINFVSIVFAIASAVTGVRATLCYYGLCKIYGSVKNKDPKSNQKCALCHILN